MARTTVGLKVGSTCLKFVEILHKRNQYKLKNLGIENFPFSEKEGGYVNHISFLAEKVKEIIQTYNFNPRRIVTGIGGESVVVRLIRVPYMKDNELREAIRWEAEEHLPYPVEEVSLDYHILEKNLLSSQGKEMSVLLVGVKKQSIDEHLQIFDQAGFCPAIIDVNSIALYNVAQNINMEKKEGVALLNIGHYITNLLILTEEHPFLVRDIKFGGDNITRSLMEQLGAGYIQVENIKKSGSLTDLKEQLDRGVEEEEIRQIIRNALNEFIKEVVRSFEYFTSNREGFPVQKVVLSGGGCLVKNIDNLLSEELGVPVGKMNPFVNISYQKKGFQNLLPSFSPLFAIPVGLGLRGISAYD